MQSTYHAVSAQEAAGTSGDITTPATSTPTELFLPVILNNWGQAWEQIDNDETEKEGALSLAVCPGNQGIRYLGTLEGLFEWSEDNKAWSKVLQADNMDEFVPGEIRDVLLTEDDCSVIYAAAFNNGLWRVKDNGGTRLDSVQNLPTTRSVALRDDFLFVGTSEGIKIYDVSKDERHNTDVSDLITKQSKSGDRIYAAAWMDGVRFNDQCPKPDDCIWKEPLSQPSNALIRDVVGSPPGENPWIVAATTSGIFYWDRAEWKEPATPPKPVGNVFALAQSEDGIFVFAAVEGGGVWYSRTADKGKDWYPLGNLHLPIIDLTVAGDSLYATTTNNGVWRWTMP